MSAFVLLTLAALITGCVYLFAYYNNAPRLAGAAKLVTMLWIVVAALIGSATLSDVYRWWIVAGLCLSTVGDAFLLSKSRFLHGLGAFFAAHLCYIAAFTHERFYMGFSMLLLIIPGGLLYLYVRNGLGRLKIPVLFYMIVILLMVYEAAARWRNGPTGPAYHAMMGAVLFAVSDSVLAVTRFKKPLRYGQIAIMTTYYTSQWLIATSV